MRRWLWLAAAFAGGIAHAQPGSYSGPAESPDSVALPVAAASVVDGPTRETLEKIENEVRRTGGQAVAVVRGGEVLHAWFENAPEPIELMSATKSVVALGIGALIDDGLLDSEDMVVSDVVSEFEGGCRESITIRMLLDHTSGLSGAFRTNEIYQAESAYEYAVGSDCDSEPGETFRYNNNAANLLMLVISRSSGEPADEYIGRRILAPLGITNWAWYRDPSGGAHGMAGLKLDAIDAARIGELVLNEGEFAGRQIVAASWIRRCVAPAQEMHPKSGLLWWLAPAEPWQVTVHGPTIDALEDSGALAPEKAASVRALAGHVGERNNIVEELTSLIGGDEAYNALRDAQRESGLWLVRDVPGNIGAYYAQGYLGQLIIAVPETDIVVVRQQLNREHSFGVDLTRMLELAMAL